MEDVLGVKRVQPFLQAGTIAVMTGLGSPLAIAQPIPPQAINACIQRTAEEMVVRAAEVRVTGAGRIESESGVRTLFMQNTVTGQTADCRVNTIDGTVLSVRLTNQPNRPPQGGGVPQAAINACIQQTAEAMVVPTREIQVVEAGPANGLGDRTLLMRNSVTGQTAACVVNTNTNRVISVQLNAPPNRPPSPPPSQGRPVSPNDPLARSCQTVVSNQIRQAFAGVQQTTFRSDTVRAFFISNAQEGIRGEGEFSQFRGGLHQFAYNCTVNRRNGRVERATFTLLR